MIDASEVGRIVVTRGDVPLEEVLRPFDGRGFDRGFIWNNARAGIADMSVYGRYAAIAFVAAPVILVVDDDVALSPEAVDGLLAAYEPGKIVANMPPEYRTRYTDSCLVGFGAIFDRDLPERAFAQLGMGHDYSPFPDEEWWNYRVSMNGFAIEIESAEVFRRTCDVVFTTLTPFTLVDLPFEYLPQTRAPNRMYRQKGNSQERERMLRLARQVRDRAAQKGIA